MQSTLNEPESDAWIHIAPLLEEAMDALGENDHDAIVLRYFEGRDLKQIGMALGIGEDTARMRINRALEKLHKYFSKRGVVSSAAIIAGAISANSVKAAPVDLAKTATTVALAKGAGGTASLLAMAKSGASAKAAGGLGLFAAISTSLVVLFQNYLGYRVDMAKAQTDEERAGVKTLYRKVGIITLGLFIPFTASVLWLSRNQSDRSELFELLAIGLTLIYLPTMLASCISSNSKSRAYYSQILAQEHGGVFPAPTWEYRSHATLFGLPLIHIRFGDRFSVLKAPVTAWVAVGSRAVGGLFAMGCRTVAPLSVGWISTGLLSIGALSFGIFSLGGIALGLWSILGALSVGWQAYGYFTAAWNAAWGQFSLAHDFALGRFAYAAEVNNHAAGHFIHENLFFRCAASINDHWLWLNLLWIIPLLVQWRIIARKKSQPGQAHS